MQTYSVTQTTLAWSNGGVVVVSVGALPFVVSRIM